MSPGRAEGLSDAADGQAKEPRLRADRWRKVVFEIWAKKTNVFISAVF